MLRPGAALIAAIVISTFACGTGQNGASNYPPLPGPSPDAEVVAVSSAIASPANPVFFYRDASDSDRLIAYDWAGNRRGEIEVAASEPYGLYPSGDGTMLLLAHAHVVSGGRSVGLLSAGTWAGDDANVCVFLNALGGRGAPRSKQISATNSKVSTLQGGYSSRV